MAHYVNASVRVLFILHSPLDARNFEHALRLLGERSHEIHVAVEREPRQKQRREGRAPEWELLDRLHASFPAALSSGFALRRPHDRWSALSRYLRLALDYLRYFHPLYDASPSLRARAAERTPRPVRRLMTHRAARTPAALVAARALLRRLEESVPASAEVEAFVAGQRPDVVLVSPLVGFGTPQADYLRAGNRLGAATGYCAYSWDNLSSKGLIRGDPDFVTVWNEIQRDEAVDLHGVDPERVFVTGASAYDRWFESKPSTSRKEFCDSVGLRPDRGYLLYLGSALVGGVDEVPYIEDWVRRIRSHGEQSVREAGILIRPHPKRPVRAGDFAFPDEEHVAFWPPAGTPVSGEDWRTTFYDSVFHAKAVVGLNTSAFIDSSVIGRPPYTLLSPELRASQEDTIHFHYLRQAGGGVLNVAESLDGHVAQLADALTSSDGAMPNGQRFIEAFVRPGGVDVPAGKRLADVIEQAGRGALSGLPAAPNGDCVAARARSGAARVLLAPLAELAFRHGMGRSVRRKRLRKLTRRARRRTRRLAKRLRLLTVER